MNWLVVFNIICSLFMVILAYIDDHPVVLIIAMIGISVSIITSYFLGRIGSNKDTNFKNLEKELT